MRLAACAILLVGCRLNFDGIGDDDTHACAVRIAGGGGSMCAITTSGSLQCWGSNTFGQIGTGERSLSPTPVPFMGSGVTKAWAGYDFSCAVEGGLVRCAGRNQHGQLGNGTTTDSAVPVTVVGPMGVIGGDGGGAHACAIDGANKLWCWGSNVSGELGDDTLTSRSTADLVKGIGDVIAVATGDHYTCAIDTANKLWCWGTNFHGQLGDNSGSDQKLPVASMIPAAGAVSTGTATTCAISTANQLYCWGANYENQVGNNDATAVPPDVPVPTLIAGISNVAGVDVYMVHACAFTSSGATYCWGHNNTRFGDGIGMSDAIAPRLNSNLTGVTSLALTYDGGCAVVSGGGGTLRCWGKNSLGEAGIGNLVGAATPVTVAPNVAEPIGGFWFACGRYLDGTLRCHGANNYGQLGDNGPVDPTLPVPVLDGIRDVAIRNHACAIDDAGMASCWGPNSTGALGTGNTIDSLTPKPVVSLGALAAISVGSSFTCARDTSDHLWCWGNDDVGELGNGGMVDEPTPQPVSVLTTVKEIATGVSHSCAVDTSGGLYCWGINTEGNLGNGTIVNSSLPLLIGSGMVHVSAGYNHSCASSPGGLSCWGWNSNGQVGVGSQGGMYYQPTLIGPAVDELASGQFHNCSRTGGRVSCWGNNASGQAGNGMITPYQLEPREVADIDDAVEIATTNDATCARRESGAVVCWGAGALGDGTNAARPTAGVVKLACP